MFDRHLLTNVDPQFRQSLGEMLAGGQLPSDRSSCELLLFSVGILSDKTL